MSIKMLREDLCRHQRRDLPSPLASAVDVLIAMCDLHRPLGVDGIHDERHTPSCGCDVKEPTHD